MRLASCFLVTFVSFWNFYSYIVGTAVVRRVHASRLFIAIYCDVDEYAKTAC